MNKGNQNLYLPVKNKAKARCQLGNTATKTKLTNILREKERKNKYAKLNRGR